jgi:CHAD domain-containing protein
LPGGHKSTATRITERVISTAMSLGPDSVEKPLSKLRKSLKAVPKDPTPNAVHDLRTRCRRLEAIMHALGLDQQAGGRRLIKSVKRIRKRAGKVRDMDVLTGFASTLPKSQGEECLVQLLEHLGKERSRFEKKLRDTVQTRTKDAQNDLKGYENYISKHFAAQKKGDPRPTEWQRHAMAQALDLSHKLAAWPRLSAENLHPFRLEVKQLNYVLKLAQETDGKFVQALDDTKDAIGEWHDWCELEAIAQKVLNHGSGCTIGKEIHQRAEERLKHAITLASRVRKEYLSEIPEQRPGRKKQPVSLKVPAMMAAARLGA